MNIQNNIDKRLDDALKSEEKSFAGFFIKNYRFTYLILAAILFLGFYSLFTLPREANPEIKVPFAIVTTVFPGANPSDIEELVTNKIEDRVKNLDNLKRYNSGSGFGVSTVSVEFEADANIDDSVQKLKDAVDIAKNDLPEDAKDPIVTEVNFSDFPIVTYSLVGDLSDEELKDNADFLKNELETIPNVSKVLILGGLTREFQVIVSQDKIAHFNISLNQVLGAISRNNFNLPAGEIEIDDFKYNVRIKGKFKNVNELNDVVVATFDNSPVYLRDVALIQDGFAKKTTESRIGFKNKKPNNTISLQVFKKTGGNILDIVDTTEKMVSELKKDNKIRKEIKIQKTNDNATFIRDDLRTLGTSGLQTFTLILIFLLVVLSLRGAFITALSVPFAFLMAFIVLSIQGSTLNGIVLFALVLSLGLMVDNSIIIIEGISEYINKRNKNIYQAAILSVWNYKWPIVSGTMTTVGAFLPMLLVSGILGQFIGYIPKTITATLLASLFVALVIIPTLATRFIKTSQINNNDVSSQRNKKRHLFISSKIKKLQEIYSKEMTKLLPNKKKRRSLIAGTWILLVLSLLVPVLGLIKVEMFPKIDVEYFIVNIELPTGSSLEKTKIVASKAEEIIAKIPEVDNYVTNLGTSASLGLTDNNTKEAKSSYLGTITVNLIDKDERKRKSFEVADSVRGDLKQIQGGDVKIEEISAGPPTGAPIEIRITGDDTKVLTETGKKLVKILEQINGTTNTTDSIKNSTGDFVFNIDKQKASYYGLDTAAAAVNLRNALFGVKASDVNINGEDIDITVKYGDDDFASVDDLKNLLISTPGAGNIKLSEIADIKLEPSLLSIGHRDGKRVITVSSQIKEGSNLQDILKILNTKISELNLPSSVNIDIGGEVEDIQQSFTELFLSMLLSILIISVILTLQFNSFRQPFIIMFALPLAIIGVMFGLVVLRMPFSFTSFIGLVSLAGIVVNDAIVLIDKINKNISLGMEKIPAIVDAGVTRMQPIFLTTLTTVAGVFPLIFASELWIGLSITIIFGLTFSTFLTLVMVPILFMSMCQKKL